MMAGHFDRELSSTRSRQVHSMNKVLTVRELADYLKVHPSTIYRLLKQQKLPAFRVGSDWRFNIESIDRWRLESPPCTAASQAMQAAQNEPRPLPEARTQDRHERNRPAWATEQAQALREHRAEALDWENLAREIEVLGKSEEPRPHPIRA